MTAQIAGLCSRATEQLLDDLSDAVHRRRSLTVRFASAGGVDVVRDVRAGVPADLVVLSRQQMTDLDSDGLLEAATLRPLFVSDVVAAVPDAAGSVSLSSEEELRAALTSAGRIAYSTGPSGSALLDLVRRWGLSEVVEPKLVRARPGTPVGSLLADGEVDLGFQQRSELSGLVGVRVLGPLPGAAAIRSTFSGAVLARSTSPETAREVLDFLGSEEVEKHVAARGMALA